MGKYSINYACGHAGTVRLYGKAADCDNKLDLLAGQDCPECKKAAMKKRMEEDDTPVTVKVVVPVTNVAGSLQIILVAIGGTYRQREALKELGFQFGYLKNEVFLSFLSEQYPKKGWYKEIALTIDMLMDEDKIKAALGVASGKIGNFDVDFGGFALDIETLRLGVIKKQAEAAREAERLARIGMDPLKAWVAENTPAGGYWNGKLYGTEEYGHKVYVSHIEFAIPQDIIAKYDDWRHNRDAINAEFAERN